MYAVINISHSGIGIPSGLIADRIGKEKTLIIGYGVFVVSSVLMAVFTGNPVYAYILAAVFGVYIGISETLQRAVIPKYVSSELRGTAYGIYNIVAGTGFFAANVIFGLLWDNYSLNTAIFYSMILASAAIIGMSIFIKRTHVPSQVKPG